MTRAGGPAVGLALLMLVSLTACSAGSPGGLAVRGDPASVCTPVGGDGGVVIALDAVENSGATPVIVDEVTPVEGSGIGVLGATITPDTDASAFHGVTDAQSERQVGYQGATLAAGERGTVKVTLELQGTSGTASGLRLGYRTEGSSRSHTVDTVIAIRLVSAGSTCT